MLAVATAYRTKGACGRGGAIQYYEKWLKSSSAMQKWEAAKYLFDAREPFFSYILAELYQGENKLEEALKYAIDAEQLNIDHAPGFPLLIASIYKKIDIAQCVIYLQKVCASNEYKGYPVFLAELSKAKALQNKGYEYKLCGYRQSKRNTDFEVSVEKAVKQLLSRGDI